MNLFQALLIFAVLILLFLYTRYLKTMPQRIFYISLFITGIYFIIFPNVTITIANALGIARGTDLIFYIFIIFCFAIFIQQHQKIKTLEQSITKIVRNLAIENVSELKNLDHVIKDTDD